MTESAEPPQQTVRPALKLTTWVAILWGFFPITVSVALGQAVALTGLLPAAPAGSDEIGPVRSLVGLVLPMGLTVLYARTTARWSWCELVGPVEWQPRVWLGSALLGVAALALAGGAASLLNEAFELAPPRQLTFSSLLTAVLLAGVAAPVLEEALYRGCVLRVLLMRWGPGAAIAISAALFSAIHFDFTVAGLGLRFVLGAVAGWLFARSRSIVPGAIAHAAWNFAVIAVGAAGR